MTKRSLKREHPEVIFSFDDPQIVFKAPSMDIGWNITLYENPCEVS